MHLGALRTICPSHKDSCFPTIFFFHLVAAPFISCYLTKASSSGNIPYDFLVHPQVHFRQCSSHHMDDFDPHAGGMLIHTALGTGFHDSPGNTIPVSREPVILRLPIG